MTSGCYASKLSIGFENSHTCCSRPRGIKQPGMTDFGDITTVINYSLFDTDGLLP